MSVAHALEGASALAFEPAAYDGPVAGPLIDALQQHYVRLYGGPDRTPVDPEEFAPPLGFFLVGRLDGVPVACGGWRRAPGTQGSAELKRMYIVAGQRRRGFARVLLAELEATARTAGVRRLRLETGGRQPEALQLYLTSGYERIENYGIHKAHVSSTCLAKEL